MCLVSVVRTRGSLRPSLTSSMKRPRAYIIASNSTRASPFHRLTPLPPRRERTYQKSNRARRHNAGHRVHKFLKRHASDVSDQHHVTSPVPDMTPSRCSLHLESDEASTP